MTKNITIMIMPTNGAAPYPVDMPKVSIYARFQFLRIWLLKKTFGCGRKVFLFELPF